MAAPPPVPIYGTRVSHLPRLAAFDLPPADRERFVRAFRNVKLGVEIVPVASEAEAVAYDGAILFADIAAASRLSGMRAVNRRMLIYVIGPMPAIARLAHFGVNAALEAPTDTAIALAVERTYLLLTGKLRRFARVPLYVPVNLHVDGLSFTALTEDLSAGGISAQAAPPSVVQVGKAAAVRIVLPATEPLHLNGVICWVAADRVGVQFERSPEQDRLHKWVEDFLCD
jgi:hypothetical protein